jgi:septum formation protein
MDDYHRRLIERIKMDLTGEHRIILGSASPRRKALMESLGVPFEVRTKTVEEAYPTSLMGSQITDYLAQLKATPLLTELKPNEILITSDTLVWHQNKALGKPESLDEARNMLRSLSGIRIK